MNPMKLLSNTLLNLFLFHNKYQQNATVHLCLSQYRSIEYDILHCEHLSTLQKNKFTKPSLALHPRKTDLPWQHRMVFGGILSSKVCKMVFFQRFYAEHSLMNLFYFSRVKSISSASSPLSILTTADTSSLIASWTLWPENQQM